MKKVEIDARGKNCPEPVVMTKNAIQPDVTCVRTIVDNEIAASNVERFLVKNGFLINNRAQSGIDISIDAERVSEGASIAAPLSYVVLITHSVMGGEDKELGEVLMKAYLGALQQGMLPSAMILMNEGVKLAVPKTSSCEHLQSLVSLGVELLVCGTCTKHFGIQTGAGRISNMFEISEYLGGAHHVVSF